LQFTATEIIENSSVSIELDNYGYKFKISFVISIALNIFLEEQKRYRLHSRI